MKRILVPTDFSDPSQKSFGFALDLAQNAGAEVIVVHMVELPVLSGNNVWNSTSTRGSHHEKSSRKQSHSGI